MAWTFRFDPDPERLRLIECEVRDKPESDGGRVIAWRVDSDSGEFQVGAWTARLDPESDGLRAREWNALDEADRGSVGVLLVFLSSLGGETVELIVSVDAAALPSERVGFHPSAWLSL